MSRHRASRPVPPTNWAGSVRFDAAEAFAPRSEDELLDILRGARNAGSTVRALGAGHSFAPVARGEDIMISLDNMQGLVSADTETGLVTLKAGTRLHRIGDLLAPYGLGLVIMGDIDQQSLAGAVQTGTHGTGSAFTGFAGTVTGLKVALADGSVVHLTEQDGDLFQAARLGLGTIGILLEVTMQCVPRYALELTESTDPLDDTVDAFAEEAERLDHYEFFWFPRMPRATVRRSHRVPIETPRKRAAPLAEWVQRDLLDNDLWEQMCRMSYLVPPTSRLWSEIGSRTFAGSPMTDDAHRVYAADRGVRFHEAEFAIPVDRFEEAFAAIRRRFEDEGVRVAFPMEIRRVAADDVWLSTAYGRESVYIAAHTYHWFDPVPYLLMVQRILEPFGARPHWGKMHWLRGQQLRELYPRFDDFLAVRAEVDPDGTFLTPYLKSLFGLPV